MKPDEPICTTCAHRLGYTRPDQNCTYRIDVCSQCGDETAVSAVRDWTRRPLQTINIADHVTEFDLRREAAADEDAKRR